MKYTIYQTTNLQNGKIYIGKHQTENPEDDYLGSGRLLREAVSKYGSQNFTKDVLFVFDSEDEMDAKEAELVTEEFVKEDTNYNLCPGGHGGWGYVNNTIDRLVLNREINSKRKYGSHSEQVKAAHRANPEYRKKLSEAGKKNKSFLGKTHTDETKQKIGEANSKHQTGRGNSQYGRIWIYSPDERRSKTIPKGELDDHIKNGWLRGRKMF